MDGDYLILETLGLCDARLHFNEALYNEAVSHMENEDGTKGPHYTLDEVEEIIGKQMKDGEKEFSLGPNNVYDYGFSLNMVYSDYGELLKEKNKIIEFANAFIFDKDAPEGKALKYYRAMRG